MNYLKSAGLISAVFLLGACEGLIDGKNDLTRDRGLDAKPLADLQAGIWIDPNGCDHWIIDDGIEGYLSQRLGRDGKPVCSGPALANQTTGDFQAGSTIQDPI